MPEGIRTVGLISDLHGNYEALQAVFEDMEDVDAIVCAGDIVGYGPSPRHCLLEMQNRNIPTVKRNHDRAVATDNSYSAGDEYARNILYQTQLNWPDNLPRERRLFDGQLKVVHDHPDKQDKYTYPSEFDASLLGDEEVLVLGHTHVPIACRRKSRTLDSRTGLLYDSSVGNS